MEGKPLYLLSLILSALALSLFTGCESDQRVSPDLMPVPFGTQRIFFRDAYALRNFVVEERSDPNADARLAEFDISARFDDPVTGEYRVDWFNTEGDAVPSDESEWTPFSLSPGETDTVVSSQPSTGATQYRISLQGPGED